MMTDPKSETRRPASSTERESPTIDESVLAEITRNQPVEIVSCVRRYLQGDSTVLDGPDPPDSVYTSGLDELPDLSREATISRIVLEYYRRKGM